MVQQRRDPFMQSFINNKCENHRLLPSTTKTHFRMQLKNYTVSRLRRVISKLSGSCSYQTSCHVSQDCCEEQHCKEQTRFESSCEPPGFIELASSITIGLLYYEIYPSVHEQSFSSGPKKILTSCPKLHSCKSLQEVDTLKNAIHAHKFEAML